MGQNLIVLVIVAAAVFYLGYITYRSIVGRGKSCGGCGTCPSKSAAGRGGMANLVQLEASGQRNEVSTAETANRVSSHR